MNFNVVFPIADYYNKVVRPIDSKRFHGKNRKYVCPLHKDTDPSLIVSNRGYYCFGCGSYGDVVDLHRKVSSLYKRKILSEIEAVQDLCSIFGVQWDFDRFFGANVKKEEATLIDLVDKKISSFDISDYRYYIVDGKIKKKSIEYFNSLLITMIDSLKGENVDEI